jgi:peptide/nickel transport system permease protein
MMRVVDSVLAIPPLILILLLASVFTVSTPVLIFVVAIVAWLAPARLVRGEAISLRTREYVQMARAMGGRHGWIVLRHIAPNAIGTIVVQATFEVANAILLLAALSYLGLGPAPPATNWGSMLSDGLNYIYEGKWWLIYPAGIAIVLTVVAFNFIGDALRAALEVRLQER